MRRRRGRRRRKSPWTTRDAPARVHALPSRSSGRLQSSSIEDISGDKSLLFLAGMSLVCAVCALCAACIGVIRAHSIPEGGIYVFFMKKYRWGPP